MIGTPTAVQAFHYHTGLYLLANTFTPPTESDASSTTSSIPEEESLAERIQALQDIIPATQRRFLTSTFNSASSWFKSGLLFGGKALWVVSTSALLLGVPWALAYAEEQQLVEMEREMKMQQSANEVSLFSSGG